MIFVSKEMTDREFEKLLKKEEKEIQVKKEKAKQRAKMRKKEAKRKAMQEKRKGDWQESGDGGNEVSQGNIHKVQ